MDFNKDSMRERTPDSDILFSRSIKAGKRVYYVDVKCDRHGENYLSITESKRIKDGTEEERPVFEKHKIFLYREDMDRFVQAFLEAVGYIQTNNPAPRPRYADNYADGLPYNPNPTATSRVRVWATTMISAWSTARVTPLANAALRSTAPTCLAREALTAALRSTAWKIARSQFLPRNLHRKHPRTMPISTWSFNPTIFGTPVFP